MSSTKALKSLIARAKTAALKQMKAKWQEKKLHRKFSSCLAKADVNQMHSHQCSHGLEAETEGLILATRTKTSQRKIIKPTKTQLTPAAVFVMPPRKPLS